MSSYGRSRAVNRARAGSAVRGASSLRRLIRRLPDEMQGQLVDALTKTGAPAAALIQRRIGATTKRRSGGLAGGVKWKVYPQTLRLRVGFLGLRAKGRLFYARILDRGRKAQTVRVHRRKEAGSLLVGGKRVSHPVYLMRVRGFAPKRFVSGGMGELRVTLNRQLHGIWDRVLRKFTGSDD